MKDLKDPATKQVPKDDAQPYYDDWKARQGSSNQDGYIDPDLIPSLLLPWWASPRNLGAPECELSMTCNDPIPPDPNTADCGW